MSKPPTPGEPLSEMFSQAPHQILGQAAHSQDTIYLRNLRLPAVVGPDAWGRPGKTQPVIISMSLFLDTSQTGSSDDLSQSFSYGQMSRDVMAILDGRDFEGVDHLILELAKAARFWPGEAIRSHISLPKAFLRVDGGFSREVTLAKQPEGQWLLLSSECVIKGMKASCIIGINPHERQEKQAVSIDLTVPFMCGDLDQADAIKVENLQAMVKQVLLAVEASAFGTLEALASLIARMCLETELIPQVKVAVEKPSALTLVEASGVTISRSKQYTNGHA